MALNSSDTHGLELGLQSLGAYRIVSGGDKGLGFRVQGLGFRGLAGCEMFLAPGFRGILGFRV